MTAPERNNKRTAKFLSYILGRHPDEFGLIPDKSGFISIKSLLKALNEEQGWRHMRMSHLKEVALTVHPCPIEIQANLIRATDTSALPALKNPAQTPKLLFTSIRQRAYPLVLTKGLQARPENPIILAVEKNMAERLGKRKDPHPVILTVQVKELLATGASLMQFGSQLYICDQLTEGTFTGPPLPKDPPQKQKTDKKPVEAEPSAPGSFFPDITAFSPEKAPHDKKQGADRKKAWQRERRLARKHKSRNRE